jgi:hypothetical protein
VSPLVVEALQGAALLWVQGGRLWRADRLNRDGGFTPWVEVDDAPGIGGRVLTEAEVARLVAPYGLETSKGSEHE